MRCDGRWPVFCRTGKRRWTETMAIGLLTQILLTCAAEPRPSLGLGSQGARVEDPKRQTPGSEKDAWNRLDWAGLHRGTGGRRGQARGQTIESCIRRITSHWRCMECICAYSTFPGTHLQTVNPVRRQGDGGESRRAAAPGQATSSTTGWKKRLDERRRRFEGRPITARRCFRKPAQNKSGLANETTRRG